jgi:hypothetical protein
MGEMDVPDEIISELKLLRLTTLWVTRRLSERVFCR